jgi:hypothetical protein
VQLRTQVVAAPINTVLYCESEAVTLAFTLRARVLRGDNQILRRMECRANLSRCVRPSLGIGRDRAHFCKQISMRVTVLRRTHTQAYILVKQLSSSCAGFLKDIRVSCRRHVGGSSRAFLALGFPDSYRLIRDSRRAGRSVPKEPREPRFETHCLFQITAFMHSPEFSE